MAQVGYTKAPVVVAYKASKHGRSKPKVKVFKSKNIDEILFGNKLTGIKNDAVILEVGVGNSFITKYNKKYGCK